MFNKLAQGAASAALISKLNAGKAPAINPLFEKDTLGIILGLLPIVPISGTITRTIDTCADMMQFDIDWHEIGKDGYNPLFDYFSRPYGYVNVKGFCGIVQNFGGKTYVVDHAKDKQGRTKTITCYSKTVDLIDSNVDPSRGETYEAKLVSLFTRATQLCILRGIKVVLDADEKVLLKANEPFDKVTAEPEETIFDHLLKLAKQRGLLLSSTFDGDLFITRAKTTQLPMGAMLEDAISIPNDYRASFDGRSRFNKWTAIGQNKNKKLKGQAQSIDIPIDSARTKTVSAPDTIAGGIVSAANYEKNKSVAQSLTIPWNVSSWYSDPTQLLLWQPGTLFTVIQSLTLNVLTPFTFMIKQVDYKFDESGATAQLQLIPPQCYTDDAVILEPWINTGYKAGL